jgi:tetratricopeptide (TPR) repeat protein
MYNKEGLFEKAYDLIDLIDYFDKCDYNLILYHQASTLIHQKRYEEAMCLLDEAIYNKKSNPNYNPRRDNKEISRFERLLALCMYLDGRFEGSEEVMQNLSFSNGHKVEIFLRKQLKMEDHNHSEDNNVYYSLLHNKKDPNTVTFECQEDGSVDYDESLEQSDEEIENWQDFLVYRYIRNMLNSDKSMGRIESDDLKGLIKVIENGIKKLTPNYSLDSDTYLINLGQPRGIVNNVRTQFVIVETIPGGRLYNLKPVVPTEDGKKNFRRLRS